VVWRIAARMWLWQWRQCRDACKYGLKAYCNSECVSTRQHSISVILRLSRRQDRKMRNVTW
jgi:hypothetical protein